MFIFVCGVSWWSSFIFFLHVAVQLSQNHLLKGLCLLHFMFLPPLSNINWPQWHGFISGLLFCSIQFRSTERSYHFNWYTECHSYINHNLLFHSTTEKQGESTFSLLQIVYNEYISIHHLGYSFPWINTKSKAAGFYSLYTFKCSR